MKFTVENIKEFNQMMDEFDSSIKHEILKKGYTDATKPLIEAAKANTTSKRIQQSMGVKYYPEGSGGYAMVGARTSKKYQGFLAYFFEKGTKERQWRNSKKNKKSGTAGHRTGKITATWFFYKAFKSTENEIFGNLYSTFTSAMNKIISKYEKKYK
jgi:hypothetical protein